MEKQHLDKFDQILADQCRPNEDALDGVYSKFANSNPFLPVTHFIDHATMGAEALVGLKLGHKLDDWISHHGVRPYEAPMTGINISKSWRHALGNKECHGDWLQYFEGELSEKPFPEVLAEWIPRLAHRCGAYLFHGLIRTAHAVRALEHRDTLARKTELSRGLGLWAICVDAQPLPSEDRNNFNLTSEAIPEILNFARIGAATFTNKPIIPNLHLVTGPMAYMLIYHYLDEGTHHIASRSFSETHWKVFKDYDHLKKDSHLKPVPDLDLAHLEELTARYDAHPLKLTEAALRAYQITNDKIFLRAAGQVQNYSILGAAAGTLRYAISEKLAHL